MNQLNAQMHDLFIYWQNEREKIRIAKEEKLPRPWTNDVILHTYRFCNVRREDDKVSRWIHMNICMEFSHNTNLPVMCSLARWINEPATLQFLMDQDVWPTKRFGHTGIYNALQLRKAQGFKIYNPAYVISPAGNHDKDKFILDTVAYIWFHLSEFPKDTLEHAYEFMRKYPGWGEFMTYQVIMDLAHSSVLLNAPDRLTFAAFGPGTRRGLNRLFGRPTDTKVKRDILEMEVAMLRSINPINLSAGDICNCLCEFDKYIRTKLDEGKPKQIYRP